MTIGFQLGNDIAAINKDILCQQPDQILRRPVKTNDYPQKQEDIEGAAKDSTYCIC